MGSQRGKIAISKANTIRKLQKKKLGFIAKITLLREWSYFRTVHESTPTRCTAQNAVDELDWDWMQCQPH